MFVRKSFSNLYSNSQITDMATDFLHNHKNFPDLLRILEDEIVNYWIG